MAMRGSVTGLMIGALCALAWACDRAGEAPAPRTPAKSPQMQAPAPESAPGRRFTPASEAARAVTGRLVVTLTTRMPDPASKETQATEILSLRGETGLAAEAQLEGSTTPSAMVEGQTIRALMELPVQASRVLVYRVTMEDAPEGAQKLCGARQTTRILVWEPDGPGDDTLRLLTLSGDAPGAAGAQLCLSLSYQRADAS
jgi:hypothetical protein